MAPTIVRPSSMDCFTFKIASSTMALPDVLAVISRQSRIGTPLAISVAIVRVNRATAILRKQRPEDRRLQQHPVDSVTPFWSPVVGPEHEARECRSRSR